MKPQLTHGLPVITVVIFGQAEDEFQLVTVVFYDEEPGRVSAIINTPIIIQASDVRTDVEIGMLANGIKERLEDLNYDDDGNNCN